MEHAQLITLSVPLTTALMSGPIVTGVNTAGSTHGMFTERDGQLNDDKHRRMLIHSIQDEVFMESLGVTSKLNPDWSFMQKLRDVGRACASQWLENHFDDVGVTSSTDIKSFFL